MHTGLRNELIKERFRPGFLCREQENPHLRQAKAKRLAERAFPKTAQIARRLDQSITR